MFKFHRKTPVLQSLFNEVAGIQRLQHSCFPVKFAKFLRTCTLKNICSCFWKVLLTKFNSNLGNTIKDCITLAVLEGFLQGAPRKELIIAPFVKRSKTATLWKTHWPILTVLPTVFLRISFPYSDVLYSKSFFHNNSFSNADKKWTFYPLKKTS